MANNGIRHNTSPSDVLLRNYCNMNAFKYLIVSTAFSISTQVEKSIRFHLHSFLQF